MAGQDRSWRLPLLLLGTLLLVLGLGAEPFARLDPGAAAALDYTRSPAGAPPPDFHLHLARTAWVGPLSLGAVPLAVFLFWLSFGPSLIRAPRATRGEDEVAKAMALACLPTGLLLATLIRLPPRADAALEEAFASLVPLQLVPASVALAGALGLISFLGALWFRLRRSPLLRDESEAADEAIPNLATRPSSA